MTPYPGSYIYKITPDGSGNAFGSAMTTPNAMAIDSSNNIFVAAIEWINPGRGGGSPYTQAVIYKFTPDGTQSIFASGYGNAPVSNGGAFDAAGNLFFSGATDGNIYKFAPDGTRSFFATGLNHPCGLVFDQVLAIFSWPTRAAATSTNTHRTARELFLPPA